MGLSLRGQWFEGQISQEEQEEQESHQNGLTIFWTQIFFMTQNLFGARKFFELTIFWFQNFYLMQKNFKTQNELPNLKTGAEMCQAQVQLELSIEFKFMYSQSSILARVGGWVLEFTRLMLISTQVEVGVELAKIDPKILQVEKN